MALITGNPALNQNIFTGLPYVGERTDVMTVQGTVNKISVLFILLVASAIFTWSLFLFSGGTGLAFLLMIVGIGGGLVFALLTTFMRTWSFFTAPIYAILEGLFIGGISALFEASYPGLVMPAVGLTFGTLFMLIVAYKSGWVRATEKFKLGVIAATGGIFVVYLVSLVLNFFHITVPFIYSGGPIGILFSLAVVVIAALNLVLDFDFIEKGAEYGAPKYMEWYAAFGIMVTLVWLYLEILRLLAKLRSRD